MTTVTALIAEYWIYLCTLWSTMCWLLSWLNVAQTRKMVELLRDDVVDPDFRP
jgi:hypothetical protein